VASLDRRFTDPLYTAREAGWMLGVPSRTFHTWARGYRSSTAQSAQPIVSSVEPLPGQRTIPFIGLAEGMVAAGFRRAGVSMQHIRRALVVLDREIGLEHALASRHLYTDGARILYDYAQANDDRELLTTVLSGQRVFADIVRSYLQRLDFDSDEWALRLVLPITDKPLLVVDPARGFGQPLFLDGGAPMEAVLERFRAGEPFTSVADDFDLPTEAVEDLIRAALPNAA
jgi:uncharacterized protein (DUF433 family)